MIKFSAVFKIINAHFNKVNSLHKFERVIHHKNLKIEENIFVHYNIKV